MAELLVLHGASDSAALTGRAHDWLSTHAVVSGGGRAGGESRAVGGAEQSLTQPSVQLLWDVQAIRMHAQPCAMVAMAAAPFANMPHLRGPPPQEHSPVQLGDSFLSALQRWRSNGGSTAREMLHQHPQLSVLHSPKGQSALCRACAAGAAQIARGILRHAGADPNCLVEAGGASALMIAVAQKDHTLVELLIAAGANVSYVAMRVRAARCFLADCARVLEPRASPAASATLRPPPPRFACAALHVLRLPRVRRGRTSTARHSILPSASGARLPLPTHMTRTAQR